MLDKKANSSDFLIWVQNVSESSGDNSHQQCIWPKTANGFIVQWWFKTFCKGDKGLEDEENSGRPLEVDKNQLRAITEADHLTAIQEVAPKLNINHSIQHLKQIGKVEKPQETIKEKKSYHFEVSSSLILCKNQWTISPLDCDLWWNVDFIW